MNTKESNRSKATRFFYAFFNQLTLVLTIMALGFSYLVYSVFNHKSNNSINYNLKTEHSQRSERRFAENSAKSNVVRSFEKASLFDLATEALIDHE